MYYDNKTTKNLSITPPFKVSSNLTPPIEDLQLEIHLSEILEKLLSINIMGNVTTILIGLKERHCTS